MRNKKIFLLDLILISGYTVLEIKNNYYKKSNSYTNKYNKKFCIYNTGTAFYGFIKWLIYKNLLINNDGNQQCLIISNRRYDHSDFMYMQKRAAHKIINLYNNFIFVK